MKNFNNPFEGLDKKMDQNASGVANKDETEEIITHLGQKQKTDADLDEKELLKRKFENILKNKIDQIPPGLIYDPEIEGIKSIYIGSRTTPDKKNYANVEINYDYTGEDGSLLNTTEDIDLHNDGSFIDERPGGNRIKKRLKNYSKDKMLGSILDTLAKAGLGKWWVFDPEKGRKIIILPPDPKYRSPRGADFVKRKRNEDRDRLAYLINHPANIMGVCPTELKRVTYGRGGKMGPDHPLGGLSDYRAFIFPRGVIFENAICENRLFHYQFDEEKVGGGRIDEETIKKIKENTISETEKERLMDVIAPPEDFARPKSQLNGIWHAKKDDPKQKQAFYQKIDTLIARDMA